MNRPDTLRLRAETDDALSRARRLLETLEEAKADTERHLKRLGRPDAYATVTGRSAIENAIRSTERLVESLERACERLSSGEHAEVDARESAYAFAR
ncbi:MAG: hypothetical protein ACTS27_09675 [Phycisphaerales bacterium]